ncbi:MAG: diphthamide biosynthesis enzyme Dph2 [Candidatus Nitrosocaldaceae archaeon]
MIKIDEDTIFNIIKERKPRRVAINGPEGLFREIEKVADKIMDKFGIEVYIIGDTCYGSCDINLHAAEMVNADILFHVAHTISMKEMFNGKVVMINAFDDIKFDSVVVKCFDILSNYKNIGLVTDSQHLMEINNVRSILSKRFNVIIGKGKGQLNDAQVFGCEFYPVYNSDVDAYIFLGQSMFHAAGVAMVTNKPTFMLDPYFNEVKEVNTFANTLKKRSILSIYKAVDAKRFGIVVGLKEGQLMLNRVATIKKRLEEHERIVRLIALTNITEDRLQLFDMDAFIQIACPRISIDNPFKKPVLSIPQAYALLDLLDGKELEIDKVFNIPHWL